MAKKERNEFGQRSKAEVWQQAKSGPEWQSLLRALCSTGREKDLRNYEIKKLKITSIVQGKVCV